MASTVSNDKEADEYREYIDAPDVRDGKIRKLAALIRKHSGNVIFFTGAGISTGAGIPDFRSGLNSATGMPAGKWCKDATSSQWSSKERQEEKMRRANTTSSLQAIPTASHMALVALEQAGVAQGLISQNCDGLHRRSGFPPEKLAELHGNTNLEYCAWCGKEYFRDFSASTGRHTKGRTLRQQLWAQHSKLNLINPRKGNHYTGRRCVQEGCDGYLFDSTIDFGDNLPEVHINRGYELSSKAGLCIVLGSRCSVSPACDMPISVGASGRTLVVVNLQSTGADAHAKLRIGAKIDDVMIPLMDLLGIQIPKFTLKRCVHVSHTITESGSSVVLRGVEADGTPVDSLWNVQAVFSADPKSEHQHRLTSSLGDQWFSHPVVVQLNQDAATSSKWAVKHPQPGDMGKVQTWPWLNQNHPGMASVVMDEGKLKGRVFSISADICSVVDGMEVLEEKTGCVVNAGYCHGSLLAHRIPVPPKHLGSQCTCLTLMFRAHYGEGSVRIPFPKPGSETLYRLEYEPMQRVWKIPKELGISMQKKKKSSIISMGRRMKKNIN